MSKTPAIDWFRRDLRVADNPALCAAVEPGRPVIGVFRLEEATPLSPGGAQRWFLHRALAALTKTGSPCRVFAPFWNTLRAMGPARAELAVPCAAAPAKRSGCGLSTGCPIGPHRRLAAVAPSSSWRNRSAADLERGDIRHDRPPHAHGRRAAFEISGMKEYACDHVS